MSQESARGADHFIALCEVGYAAGAFDVWLVLMFPDHAQLFPARERRDVPDESASGRLDALLQEGGEPVVIVLVAQLGTSISVQALNLPGHDDEFIEAAAIEAVAEIRQLFRDAGCECGRITVRTEWPCSPLRCAISAHLSEDSDGPDRRTAAATCDVRRRMARAPR